MRRLEAWQERVRDLLASGKREEALRELEARATAHAGTPKADDKRAAVKLMFEALGSRPDELWSWMRELVDAGSPTRLELACLLLSHQYEQHRSDAVALMPALAGDAHWEVRLWAGGLFEELLARYCDDLYGQYQAWASHPSQFVRVAVATSVMANGHHGHPERAEALLDLVEPLLGDHAHEVERNLGPYAIGAGLLRLFPKPTLERVRRWAGSDDEQVRWNVAMVFSAAEARKYTDAGLEVLSELAHDGRRKVWQTVSSALRNLVKGDPDRLVPVLRGWLEDGRKLPAALALRGATKAKAPPS